MALQVLPTMAWESAGVALRDPVRAGATISPQPTHERLGAFDACEEGWQGGAANVQSCGAAPDRESHGK